MLSPEAKAASLADRIKTRIAADGPLTVEEFMQACLHDAREGAYAARQPIGAKGHFVTAPEISQIFGELIGLWAVTVWQCMGEPARLTVAELGPGRGTLMADAMRAWRGFPKFRQAVSVALIETSLPLTELQRGALAEAPVPVRWHSDLGAAPATPLVVIANEFVDALPIRQFVRRGTGWRERVVTDDGKGFAFADGAPAANVDVTSAPEGAIRETRPAVEPFLRELACRAQQAPLAALIVDYGYEEPGFGDTLQAVRGHRFADPLAAPGETDLSAHVDFADLKARAGTLGLKSHGPMPQGEFLLKLGLAERRERLMKAARAKQKEAIASGALRLADPAQMGVLFKALALTSVALPPPPPFV